MLPFAGVISFALEVSAFFSADGLGTVRTLEAEADVIAEGRKLPAIRQRLIKILGIFIACIY